MFFIIDSNIVKVNFKNSEYHIKFLNMTACPFKDIVHAVNMNYNETTVKNDSGERNAV